MLTTILLFGLGFYSVIMTIMWLSARSESGMYMKDLVGTLESLKESRTAYAKLRNLYRRDVQQHYAATQTAMQQLRRIRNKER